MKINNAVSNFTNLKKLTEPKPEKNTFENQSPANIRDVKINQPNLSIVGGNSGDGGGPFRKLDKIVHLEPEVRIDSVNKFKELIKSGEYIIDSDKISSKMISESLVDDIL